MVPQHIWPILGLPFKSVLHIDWPSLTYGIQFNSVHDCAKSGGDSYVPKAKYWTKQKGLYAHQFVGLLIYLLYMSGIVWAGCSCDSVPINIGEILRSLHRLSSLDLSDSNYPEGQTAEFPSGLSALRCLVLKACKMVTPINLHAVSKLVDLEHLDLADVYVRPIA